MMNVPVESNPAEELADLLEALLSTTEREGVVHISVTMTRGDMTLSEAWEDIRRREDLQRRYGLRGLLRRWIAGAR